MPATPGIIPDILIVGYVEVSEFFFQMSMRPGVRILEKLKWVIKDQDTRLKPQLVVQMVRGFLKRSTYWSSNIEVRSLACVSV